MKEAITNGIIGLFEKYPGTAPVLKKLAQDVLQGPGSLDQSEREMIATFVSAKNRCYFCSQSHGAITEALKVDPTIVSALMRAEIASSLPERMRHLLMIAEYVTENQLLPLGLLSIAEKAGVTDQEVHDTVLVASIFCMFNRYVESLSRYPSDSEFYRLIGEKIVKEGYV
jgi:uncharacterized peroxidase-related enzyme